MLLELTRNILSQHPAMSTVSDGLTAYTDTVYEARQRGSLLAQVQAQNQAILLPSVESVPVERKCSINLSYSFPYVDRSDPSNPSAYVLI